MQTGGRTMGLFLSLAALSAFSFLPAGASVLLRCGLSACLRFSPRAALALSSIAALSACAAMLLGRGGLRAVPIQQRAPVTLAAFGGGTAGRMLLLMFTARFSGSLELAQAQAIPLLLLALAAAFSHRLPLPSSKAGLFTFALLCSACDGFFGCGSAALFLFFGKRGVRRRLAFPQGAALLCGIVAQFFALLLTLFSGAAQVFPSQMLLALSAASALGGVIFEKTKKRGTAQRGLRIALCVYMLLAASAGIEQAFLD